MGVLEPEKAASSEEMKTQLGHVLLTRKHVSCFCHSTLELMIQVE